MEETVSVVGLCEKPVFLRSKGSDNSQWPLDVSATKTNNDSCDHVSMDSAFATVKLVVDENEMLNKKYNDLLESSKKASEKSVLYEKRIKRLQRLSLSTRNKFRRLRELEAGVKKEPDLMSKVFSPAQIDVLLGRTKVKWSDDDLARSFTLRHMGGKECYLYLKNTLNIPLPSLSCVQRWTASDA